MFLNIMPKERLIFFKGFLSVLKFGFTLHKCFGNLTLLDKCLSEKICNQILNKFINSFLYLTRHLLF